MASTPEEDQKLLAELKEALKDEIPKEQVEKAKALLKDRPKKKGK